jgi:hypothetical protein
MSLDMLGTLWKITTAPACKRLKKYSLKSNALNFRHMETVKTLLNIAEGPCNEYGAKVPPC